MRRDPSDIIKVGDLYCVWYAKGAIYSGYNGTVWYATSLDGHIWTEQGEAVARSAEGGWDGQSVFTPHIPVAGGAYRLEVFTGSGKGDLTEWGVHIGGIRHDRQKGVLPCIQRFELGE